MCSRRGGTMGIEVAQGVCPDRTSIITRHAPLHPAWSRPTSPGWSAQYEQARLQLSPVQHAGAGRWRHPAALFPPTAKDLEARRHPASLVRSEGNELEDVVSGKDENDAGDDDAVDGEDPDRLTPEYDEPGENEVSLAGTDASGWQAAT